MDLPPRLDPEIDITPFEDGLHDIIPEQLREILLAMEILDQNHEDFLKATKTLRKKGELDEFGVYFWTLYAELVFSEYYIYQKWLKYWLALYEKLPDVVLPKKTQKEFDNTKVEQARLVPIEDHFEGKLKTNGSRLIGLCPFHQERNGSFFIYTQSNTYFCFGACHKGGDVIDYIMKLKKLAFQEAINYLV